MIARSVRIAVLAAALCIALPSAAAEHAAFEPAAIDPAATGESASTDAPLTVAQAREAQALFGFDGAIPVIIEMTFKQQPEYASITAQQRECTLREASPALQGMFDKAFIELFGDTGILDGWRAFARTAGGKRFIDDMRTSAMRKVSDQPLDEVSSSVAAMSDAEKEDVRVFAASRAATVLHKSFPDVDIAPEEKAALLARIQQTCGVTLSNL